MKSEPHWLSTKGVDPDSFRALPVIVRDKAGIEIPASLEVEKMNKDWEIVVSANYNQNPFPGQVTFAGFYLTQDQFNAVMDKGPKCVLDVPG